MVICDAANVFPRLDEKKCFESFLEGHRDKLASAGMILQWEGAIAEKAYLLGSIRWNPLADRACNMPLLQDLMGQVDATGEKQYFK